MILIQNCAGYMHTNVSSMNPSLSVLILRHVYVAYVACIAYVAYVSDPVMMSRS